MGCSGRRGESHLAAETRESGIRRGFQSGRNNDRDRSTRRAPKDNGRRVKKKVCIFCKDRIDYVDYKDVNVLEDMGIREGIKTFSQWPTIPQLYVKGEFVGGCDIIREMFQQGELGQLLDDKGVTYDKARMTA